MSTLARAGLRLVAFDQRGYSAGARPDAVRGYAITELARDVLDIAGLLGAESFHLVGHDWGASVGWYLAAHEPSRVRTFTALSVPHLAAYGWALQHDDDQKRMASYIKLLRMGKAERVLLEDEGRRLRASYGDRVPAHLVESYMTHFRRPGALTGALNWYRAMGRDLADLPPIEVPTTYLWGDRDVALARAGAERCGDHVRADYKFIELRDVSHWIPEEAPTIVAQHVLDRVTSE